MGSIASVHVGPVVVALASAFILFGSLEAGAESIDRTPAVVPTTQPPTTQAPTTTLPSAVTTIPQGCPSRPQASAVFIGELVERGPVTAVFSVEQLRTGSLEGHQQGTRVEVRYGTDVKFLDVGTRYIVGVAPDPISGRLESSVRDSADVFGGAEIAGSNTRCPEFEQAARTLTIDAQAVPAGVFTGFFDQPWRIALALVVPPVIVVLALLAAVWVRRASIG